MNTQEKTGEEATSTVGQIGSTGSTDLNQDSAIQYQDGPNVINQNGPKVIKLSDGRIAEVKKGKGKHAMLAQRLTNGNQEKYLAAMISLLTTIDGNAVVLEDLEDLPLCDYLALQAEFSEQNF